jgi:hypothetical protein
MTSTQEARDTARTRAQSHFLALEERDQTVRAQIEKERSALAAKTERLRTLRLAKEEADRADALANPGDGADAAKPRRRTRRTTHRTIRVS